MSMISEKLRKARQGVKEEDTPAAQALRLAAYGAASGRLREQEEQEAQGLQSLRLAAYGAATGRGPSVAELRETPFKAASRSPAGMVTDSGTGTSVAKQEYEAGKERARYLDFATGAELQRRLREAEDALSLSGGGRAEDAAARAAKAELDKWQSDVRAAQSDRWDQKVYSALDKLDDETRELLDAASRTLPEMMHLGGSMEAPSMDSGEARRRLREMGWSDEDIRTYSGYSEARRNAASAEAEEIRDRYFAEQNPVLANAVSVMEAPVKALGLVESVRGVLPTWAGGYGGTGRPTDVNSPFFTFNRSQRNIRGETGENIEDDAWRFLYNAGMSAADSALNMSIGSGIAGAAGLTGEAAQKAVSDTVSWIMGSQVAADTVMEEVENGYSNEAALGIGIARGLFEHFSEKYSIENILKDPGAWYEVLGKSFVSEGSEEVASNWLNRAFDSLIGHKTDVQERYEQIMASGETDEALALARALVEVDGESFLAGGISGLGMSGVAYGTGTIQNIRTGRAYQTGETVGQIGNVTVPGVDEATAALIESGLESPDGTESRRLAETALARAQEGKEISARMRGELAAANAAQVASEESAATEGAQEERSTGDRGRQIVTEGNPRSGAAPTENEAARAAENVTMTAEDRVNAAISAEERSLEAMERTAAGMGLGENGAAYLRASYRGGDAAAHLRDYVRAYNAGVTGEELGTATGTQQIAWNAGRMDAAQSVRDNGKAVVAKKPGLVRDASFKAANISAEQERALDVLGRVTGSEIRFGRLSEDENARYDARSATITVNVNAKDPVMAAVIHEIVHRIRDVSPEAYKTLRQFVVDNMSDRALAVSTKVTGKVYNTNDVGYITEEMVANAFGRMAENNALLDQFVREHRTAAQRVLDALRDLIDRVRTALRRGPTQRSLTAAQNREFEDLLGRLEEAQRTMEAALDTVGGEVEDGKLGTTPGDAVGEVKASRRYDGLYMDKAEAANRKTGLVSAAEMEQARRDRQAGASPQIAEDGVRYSRTTSDDAYAAAVESGDMETAQRMVDEAAKSAGYDSPKLYHGTRGFGFTRFDATRSDDGISLFATSSPRTAETYSGVTTRNRIKDRATVNVDDLHGEELLKEVKKQPRLARYNDYRLMSEDEREVVRSDARQSILAAKTDAQQFIADHDGAFDAEKTAIMNRLTNALTRLASSGDEDALQKAWDDWQEAVWDFKDIDDALAIEFLDAVGSKQLFFAKNHLDDVMYAGDMYFTGDDYSYSYVFDNQLALELDAELHKGIYELYGRSGRQLVIDADGANWNQINAPDELNLYGPQRTRDIAAAAKANGYNSVLFRDLRDNGGETAYNGTSDVYIFFNANDLKSADPATYDDEGNVIPLSERFNPADEDIRRSRSGREILDEQIQQFGAIPEGENPVRDVPTPVKTSDRQKLSQTVRTVLEAQATPEEMVPTIEKLTADGTYSYTQYSDKAAIQNAEDYVKNLGWAKAYGDWLKDVQRGVVNKTNTAIGWALYNNAANSGDTESALTVLDAIVKHQRAAAQAVQATRILKKLSPETQLYNVAKSVQRLQEEINQRYGEEKGPKLKVDPKLGEEFLNAGTDEQRAKVLQAIYKDIGRQMPTHFMDRWNAWRYLAMLGNPRTHVRNILGNAGFAPVVAVKDLTATAIEAAVDRVSGGKLGRTKGNLVGKGGGELLQAAWKDYAKVADQALGGGKYQDGVDADAAVQEGRIIFGNTGAAAWDRTVGRALERARRFNGTALDKEDVWFSKPHYALALAQYCKANKITPEMIAKGEGIAAARAYAIKEAQKATYRDTNQFSQAISRLGRGSGWDSNRVTRGVSTVIEGILPFRKTPANILARGVEYSPLGLLRSLTVDMIGLRNARIAAEAKAQGKKPPKFRVQPISGAEMIDHLAAGLTGTGLVMLGAWLASLGLIRGHGGDDDKRRKQDELMGHQNYALELPDGTSITLDWLAPECLPFFIGVNLWEQGQEETDGPKLADILSAVGNVTEPMLEMSCLQSLNAVFDTVGYAKEGDVNALTAALASAATSYLTQALPTLAGQGERTAEDKRYTTYADKNSFLTGDMQYTLGKASARIPGLDYGQIPYIDAWGREELTGSFLGRAFNNFINPSFTSRVDESAMEKELLRLYEATGESVLPQRAPRYFNVDKERKDLTGDEYVTYATARGRTAYTVLGSMVTSSSYKALSDANKAKAVEMAYTYANQTAMTTVGGKISTSYKWVSEALEAKKKGVSPDKYILIYTTVTPIGGIPDADGKTIDNSRGLQRMEAIYNVSGLTDEQRRYLFECFDVGKTIIDYNKAKVEEELKKMRGK